MNCFEPMNLEMGLNQKQNRISRDGTHSTYISLLFGERGVANASEQADKKH